MADQPLSDRLDGVIDALVARGDASSSLRDTELAPLARVAADLRHYPNREFTARLPYDPGSDLRVNVTVEPAR